MALTRWAIPLLGLLCAACTPMHSLIKPPYEIDGVPHTNQQVQMIATQRCQATAPSMAVPPQPFTTDGCSLWPNGAWRACCIEHDVRYWCGGPNWQRRKADYLLRECVRQHSSALNADLMYIGVRFGGARLLPFPWRWGYGYLWPYLGSVTTDLGADLYRGTRDHHKATETPEYDDDPRACRRDQFSGSRR